MPDCLPIETANPAKPAGATRRGILVTGVGLTVGALASGNATALAGTSPAWVQDPNALAPSPRSARPYVMYWFPKRLPNEIQGEGHRKPDPGAVWRRLSEWTPQSDPDLAFNRSVVPLAKRFTPVPANASAHTGQARVAALASFGSTSRHPSQGAATADYYAFTHWSWIDLLVYWAGSAGEGVITAPSAPIVDAAHRNGVRVLGNVFLPQREHGGLLDWTRDLLEYDEKRKRFPIADKLIQVARTYGFDGWFINPETQTERGGVDFPDTPKIGASMLAFLKYLRKTAPDLHIQWYDSLLPNGKLAWQNQLNSQNEPMFAQANSMFLNFWWSSRPLGFLESSTGHAKSMRRNPYDLYAGITTEPDRQGRAGYNKVYDWDRIVPADRPHNLSVGFFEADWTFKVGKGTAQRRPVAFHERDDHFWTGRDHDPSAPQREAWRPASVYEGDRSTVTSLPFGTTFNTGHGLRWYRNGKVASRTPWNHLGLQDRLPSRRGVTYTKGREPRVTFRLRSRLARRQQSPGLGRAHRSGHRRTVCHPHHRPRGHRAAGAPQRSRQPRPAYRSRGRPRRARQARRPDPLSVRARRNAACRRQRVDHREPPTEAPAPRPAREDNPSARRATHRSHQERDQLATRGIDRPQLPLPARASSQTNRSQD